MKTIVLAIFMASAALGLESELQCSTEIMDFVNAKAACAAEDQCRSVPHEWVIYPKIVFELLHNYHFFAFRSISNT